jgi:hypothetical protein
MEHGSAQTLRDDQGVKLLLCRHIEYLLARTDTGADIETPLTSAALASVQTLKSSQCRHWRRLWLVWERFTLRE